MNSKKVSIIAGTVIMLAVVLFPRFIAFVSGYTPWERDVTKNGMHFKKVRYAVKNKEVKKIIAYLAEDAEIGGMPCASNWVHFEPDWMPCLFNASKDFEMNGLAVPKGSWVATQGDGSFSCVFPDDREVQGYLCESGGGVKGVRVSFYADGRLRSFFSKSNLVIDSIPCKGNALLDVNLIELHENGRLKTCILARPAVIEGISYTSGRQLFFDKDGKIEART